MFNEIVDLAINGDLVVGTRMKANFIAGDEWRDGAVDTASFRGQLLVKSATLETLGVVFTFQLRILSSAKARSHFNDEIVPYTISCRFLISIGVKSCSPKSQTFKLYFVAIYKPFFQFTKIKQSNYRTIIRSCLPSFPIYFEIGIRNFHIVGILLSYMYKYSYMYNV